jgi:hypothetical protein
MDQSNIMTKKSSKIRREKYVRMYKIIRKHNHLLVDRCILNIILNLLQCKLKDRLKIAIFHCVLAEILRQTKNGKRRT